MKWQGVRRNSLDVSTTAEEGLLLTNGRFKVSGELRRRRGMARSNIIKKDYGVTNISGFSAFQSNVMAALTDGANLQGYQQPAALWGDNGAPYVAESFLPAIELPISGGYLGTATFVTLSPITYIDTPGGGSNPSIFPGVGAVSRKYRYLPTTNESFSCSIYMDFSAQETYGPGGPTEIGGGLVVGFKNVNSGVYGYVDISTYISGPTWYAAYVGIMWDLSYDADTMTFTITDRFPT